MQLALKYISLVMRISAIYKIQSRVKPERIYIGSAINLKYRWWRHLSQLRRNKHHSIKLQRHFNKYGETDLQFSILLSCEKEDLIKIEQYFIDSYNPYFNICRVAGSVLGIKRSLETIKKMSESGKKYKPTEETRLKLSKSHLGEILFYLEARKGIPRSEETKQRIREKNMGHLVSERTRNKISTANKGKIVWNKGLLRELNPQTGSKRKPYKKRMA
jgi:group I intron endonuclease